MYRSSGSRGSGSLTRRSSVISRTRSNSASDNALNETGGSAENIFEAHQRHLYGGEAGGSGGLRGGQVTPLPGGGGRGLGLGGGVMGAPKSDLTLAKEELDFYYGIVKRHILNHQSVTTGLFPVSSGMADSEVGSVRDTVYCCQAMWALYLGYEKIDQVKEKGYEMRQSCVTGMQGVLCCWMRQSAQLEEFKNNQNAAFALHVLFDLDTGLPVRDTKDYHHLQLDVVSLYLLFLAQAIKSGLEIICNMDEVQFVQNLVYFVERTYRTPDFGMWGRGTAANNGTSEISASSIAMAKAALESMNGFNLYGNQGASYSSLYVDVDAHNRNRMILDSLLPRQSSSKSIDASLLPAISFPAFATHKESVYKETKRAIVENLSGPGEYGFKRFLRDGYGTCFEGNGQRYYPEGKLKAFDSIECEWPIFYAYMIVDGVFTGKSSQVERYQRLLKRRLCYTEHGDPLLPMYYTVRPEDVVEERACPGSVARAPSPEGSTSSNVFLWGQSMLVIADLLTSNLITHLDLDPMGRHLPPHLRSQSGNTTNFETKGNIKAIVQVAVISESSQLQATLNTFGIKSQTPDEIEPVQIWSQRDMVKVLEKLGHNKRMKITGRPCRPLGVLGTSLFYRIAGKTVLCYPLTFSASDFYLSHDLALVAASVRSDLRFLTRRWKMGQKRPTYCLLITETNLKDPQFHEILNLLSDIRMQRIEGVTIQLGRLQNLMTAAAVETFDFSNYIDLKALNIVPYKQAYHKFLGYTSATLTEMMTNSQDPSTAATCHDYGVFYGHTESERDFVSEFSDVSSNVIEEEILQSNDMLAKIQLLGILLKRHGTEYNLEQISVGQRLKELNREACVIRYWRAVRYTSSLLRQIVDSISPFITQILVNGKQVTVGTIGAGVEVFDKPMTPAEIHSALYTKVQPFNVIAAVLQQELIRYCGSLISVNRDIFSGMIKVRMGWVLRAIEIYHDITSPIRPPEKVENLPPSKIRRLVYEVLLEGQIIKQSYESAHLGDNLRHSKPSGSKTPKSSTVDDTPTKSSVLMGFLHSKLQAETNAKSKVPAVTTKLSVYQARQINGCLVKTPTNFYEDCWFVLQRCKGGVKIDGRLLPQEPTLSNYEGNLEAFAHEFESMFNGFRDPVEKQMVVEFFCVVAIVLKRHPELRLNKILDAQKLISDAVAMYSKEKSASAGQNFTAEGNEKEVTSTPVKDSNCGEDFKHESVSTTSMFFAKSTVQFIMYETDIIEFVENSAASVYECPIQ